MLDASNRIEAQVSTIQAISTIVQLNDLNKSKKETNLGQACQEQARAGKKETFNKKVCWIFVKNQRNCEIRYNCCSTLAVRNKNSSIKVL